MAPLFRFLEVFHVEHSVETVLYRQVNHWYGGSYELEAPRSLHPALGFASRSGRDDSGSVRVLSLAEAK